ncbi:MAG: hypothetical protein IJ324_11985 [Lachnospiraceae bacterium]|nr:hypothetical protein [Lachnospiraceae bacterium]
MKYLCGDYRTIANKIKSNNLNVAVYGAGMIGQIFVPHLIEEYDLFDNLLFFMDMDKRKQGNKVQIGTKEYAVESPNKLREIPKDTIILITNSNYSPIAKMLDEIEELAQTEGYIIPILQACNVHEQRERIDIRLTHEQVIPKKIHYCWFSRNPIPDYLKRCIDSWYKYCPEYEIVKWDEDNYDINKNLYMKQAYEAKKWGFVPDIARLDILYEHGGIYLDTDVELIRSLDDLLYQSAFVGVEKWGNINVGGGCGAVSHHPIIKRMLDFRINEKFLLEDGGLNQTTCGFYETRPLIKLGMKPNNTIQRIGDMTIYSSDFFHPYDYMSGETIITENTYSIHHFNGGWLDEKKMAERKNTQKIYQQMLERMRVATNG